MEHLFILQTCFYLEAWCQQIILPCKTILLHHQTLCAGKVFLLVITQTSTSFENVWLLNTFKYT